MNKYEEAMNSGIKAFSKHGFWFKNDLLEVGYSYAEVDYFDEGLSFGIDSEDYNSWEEFFESNKNIEFVITKDCAESDNFTTWSKFKEAIDGKINIHIVTP